MRPTHNHMTPDLVRVALRWSDEPETFLARSVPFRVEAGGQRVVVAPGEPMEVPRGPLVATAIVPYGRPLRFELTASDDGILEIPKRADAVTQMAFEGQALTEKATGMTAVTGTLAFNATRWSQAPIPLPESNDLRFERGGDLVRVSSGESPSAPARLVMASRTTPARGDGRAAGRAR